MRTGAASAASAVSVRRHNENDVTTTIAGLCRCGDWRHVATSCTAPVLLLKKVIVQGHPLVQTPPPYHNNLFENRRQRASYSGH